MAPESVRKGLLEGEGHRRAICLNDGSRVIIRGREQWFIAPEFLIVLDHQEGSVFVDYRNIAAIRILKNGKNGGRART